jgi:hypothetical protein
MLGRKGKEVNRGGKEKVSPQAYLYAGELKLALYWIGCYEFE